MNPDILVIDADAIGLLNSTLNPSEEWFEKFATADSQDRVRSGIIDNVAIISSNVSTAASRLLVIDLGRPNFFDRFTLAHKREVLRRIFVSALSSFTNNILIPRSWASFNHGSRISYHALPLTAKRASPEADARIEMDRAAFGDSNLYVFNCSNGWSDLASSASDKAKYDNGRRAFLKFVAEIGSFDHSQNVPGAIQLSDDSFFHQENRTGYAEWYKSRLTTRQREFVDASLNAPIRLRGMAGTGKTLALAVKLLVAAKQRLSDQLPTRFLFLTHSAAVSQAINALLSSLDNEGIIAQLNSREGFSLTVSTLLDVAMDAVGADLESDGVSPLATDALEGRMLQLELIESGLISYAKSKEWSLLRGLASDHFKRLMASPKGSSEFRRFAWEIMNEFACVLDADGVQAKPSLRKQYLSAARQSWMMPLDKGVDRQVVLALYDSFNREIREMHAISVDQVISDYLNYLDTFRWNAVREKRGYDVIFVDELHLFNRQERMVLHGLVRSGMESPSLFMAYDAKQAPSDTFMPNEASETSSSFWGRLRVGGIHKVELDQVFRYTPQIAAFIGSLDQSFPALDLGDEWGEYNVSSQAFAAELPSITVLSDEKEMYTKVMSRAHAIKRKGGQKFTLAVLCCNPDRFMLFRDASAHKKDFFSISSREEAAAVKPDAFRFVLSAPEYVAGLQFDCVMLLDVNKAEIPAGAYSTSVRRRFISTVYLGASRARRHLEIFCTELDGGPSDILDSAVQNTTLLKLSWSLLPDIGDVAVVPSGSVGA
ncbi:UvrD-helicase domain-containing protein [Rhodanobacter sp. Root561]|uniref:UvrD-helicase domain-containing protein n=1 Tax=Rhodanobacter sp. Root561 TaxID=1736560 RepID=UPI000AA97362|nr:UvrD-helicase domain-containing protein [Rhodanobacter sp. Root561]